MKFSYYVDNSDLSKEDLYDRVLKASLEGDENLLLETLNIAKYNNITLDLSYQEGLFAVIAAQKGNREVLEILCNYDKNIIPNYGVEMLSHAANYGKIDSIKYLLDKGANPLELKGTTAYNNYQEVENIFNQYLEEHKVDISGDIHSTTNNLVEI
jgi:hypothetical protein